MTALSANDIIEHLGLVPLEIEGGYFRETYRSNAPYPDEPAKNLSTAIYYMLTPDTFSEMHRLSADEIFHFYLGDTVLMLQLHVDGTSGIVTLGQDIAQGEHVQVIVPKGTWQGMMLRDGGKFALMGTTMSPGFDYADYEAGRAEDLIEHYPGRRELIQKLTRT